jgi:hypothetical protein
LLSNVYIACSKTKVAPLNDLLNTTSEAVNALRALDSPVDQWDQLLVHLLLQKLDIRTREDWEFSLGSNTDFPSYKQLAQYLSACARAQESMEGYGTPRKPSWKPTQSTPTQSSHQKGKPAHVHVAQQQTLRPATSLIRLEGPNVLQERRIPDNNACLRIW